MDGVKWRSNGKLIRGLNVTTNFLLITRDTDGQARR